MYKKISYALLMLTIFEFQAPFCHGSDKTILPGDDLKSSPSRYTAPLGSFLSVTERESTFSPYIITNNIGTLIVNNNGSQRRPSPQDPQRKILLPSQMVQNSNPSTEGEEKKKRSYKESAVNKGEIDPHEITSDDEGARLLLELSNPPSKPTEDKGDLKAKSPQLSSVQADMTNSTISSSTSSMQNPVIHQHDNGADAPPSPEINNFPTQLPGISSFLDTGRHFYPHATPTVFPSVALYPQPFNLGALNGPINTAGSIPASCYSVPHSSNMYTVVASDPKTDLDTFIRNFPDEEVFTLLNMKQNEAARKIGLTASGLCKDWSKISKTVWQKNKKWPHGPLEKLDKFNDELIHMTQQGSLVTGNFQKEYQELVKKYKINLLGALRGRKGD